MSGKRTSHSSVPSDNVEDVLVGELMKCVDKGKVRESCGLSKRDDRLYGYVEAISEASAGAFRYCESDGCVYYFEGRIWKKVCDRSYGAEYESVMGRVTRRVLRGCSENVSRGDLLSCEKRITRSVLDGAITNKIVGNPRYICFKNGVWDFGDPTCPVRHEFAERLPVTEMRDYEYDAGARCPMWESFLNNALSRANVETLQMFFGLGVVPRGMLGHSVEKMIWMIGNGGNGKSTCLDVLEHVYGEGMFSHASLPTLLDTNTISRMLGTAPIIGKRYNRCDEMQMADITRKQDLLKRICSGDHVEFRRIKGNTMSSNDVPFLVFSMNKMPVSAESDKALMRRLLIVRFEYTVSGEKMDTSLYQRLITESSGIWNWCVDGYRKLTSGGFRFARTEDNALEQRKMMIAGGQQMQVWLNDEGLSPVPLQRGMPAQRVTNRILYDMYCEWCEKEGIDSDCENLSQFGIMMCGRGKNRGLGYNKRRYSEGFYYFVYSNKKLKYSV